MRAALSARARGIARPTLVALMDEVARVEDRIRWEVYPRIILEILIIKLIDITACGGDAPAPPKKKKSAPQAVAPSADPSPESHATKTKPVTDPEPPDPETPALDEEFVTASDNPELNVESDEAPAENEAPQAPAQQNGFAATWSAILAHIKKKNMPRYFVFADAYADMPDDNTIVLSYQPEHQFKKENAQDKESAALLHEAVLKHCGREMRIKFRIDRGGDEPAEHDNGDAAAEPEAPPPAPQAQNLSLFDQVRNVFPKSVEIE